MIDLTIHGQCQRLLGFLKDHGEVATSEARDLLFVMHPAGRVYDLKKRGFNIETVFRKVSDNSGVVHRQAVYRLEASHAK